MCRHQFSGRSMRIRVGGEAWTKNIPQRVSVLVSMSISSVHRRLWHTATEHESRKIHMEDVFVRFSMREKNNGTRAPVVSPRVSVFVRGHSIFRHLVKWARVQVGPCACFANWPSREIYGGVFRYYRILLGKLYQCTFNVKVVGVRG